MADDKTVPYERFAAVVAERKDLRAQLDAASVELTTARAAAEGAEAHKTAAADWQAKHAALEGQFGRYRDLTANGISDPDVADVAEFVFGKLPEKDRPTFGDALKSWRAEPEKAPTALRPFLAVAAKGEGGGGAQGGAAKGAQGGAAKGAQGGAPAGGSQMDGRAITAMDLDTYRQSRETILASYRGGR